MGTNFASWGSGQMYAQAAKYGVIGGLTSVITGGNFQEGFSIGAAGYLYNDYAHMGGGGPKFPGLSTVNDKLTGTIPVDCSGSTDQCGAVMSRLAQTAQDNGFDIQFRPATRWEMFRDILSETTLDIKFFPEAPLVDGDFKGGEGGGGVMNLFGDRWNTDASATVAHELMHNLGLGHNDFVGSLMYPMTYSYTRDTLLPKEAQELTKAYGTH
jgi:hypothetical protein